jgi:small subunit ribosomal protein S5
VAQERQQEQRGGKRGRRDEGGPGGGGGRSESDQFESVIQIKRCAAVVKGGRRFSFNALVVIGDKRGSVAFGYGKAKEVPPAVEKAVKSAQRRMLKVPVRGTTIPHQVVGRFGASKVLLIPAAPGTGIIAGRGVRDVVVAAGIHDILTKNLGSTNPINVVKATLDGLSRLRTRESVGEMRGVNV